MAGQVKPGSARNDFIHRFRVRVTEGLMTDPGILPGRRPIRSNSQARSRLSPGTRADPAGGRAEERRAMLH